MKKIKLSTLLLFLAMLSLTFVSCSKDDDDDNGGGGKNETVTISEDGSVSGGHIFSAVDDKNFFIDYIKYSVVSGHLEVTGYDKTGLKSTARIVSQINYKGNVYQVLAIGNHAFEDCSSLTSITIPSSVTSIGFDAFYKCSGLTSINIPSSVTSIGSYAFYGCSGLTSITIPSSVTSIGEYTFYECSELTAIHCKAKVVPKAYSDSFYHYYSCTLYVPKESVETYKRIYPWSEFVTIIGE